jgi:flagellar hook-associated protein 1 FlgK
VGGVSGSASIDATLKAADADALTGSGAGSLTGDTPYTLTLDDSGELTIEDDSSNSETISGISAGDQVSFDGVTLTVNELPESGETQELTISDATATPGDNRNALELQSLQERDAVGGSATLSGAYASIVSDVGNRTNITQVNLDAQQGLTEQLEEVQQSQSGVNLDEEAANLIRYQQFYQANAQVIETGSTILDTILGVAR